MSEEKVVASMGKVERVNFVNQTQFKQSDEGSEITDEEQANIDNGLNADGSAKEAANVELTDEQKQTNIAAGLNEDGTAKTIELTAEQKQENIDKGLNEDGTAKVEPITEEKKKENIAAGLNEDGTAKNTPLTDEQIKAEYEKRFPTTAELTPEQKIKQEQTFEKRQLDWFVENGGTVDAFAAMKLVATADLTELSERELEAELTAAGFTEEQKKEIRAERYYQLDDEEIESLDDDEKEIAKKKKEFGTAKLSKKAEHKKNLAVGFFEKITQALNEQDADAADEIELAQKVDSHFQKAPSKITLELGKTPDNADIAPLEMDVPAEIIAEVRETLKNTDKRNNILFTQEGNINIEALSGILIRNRLLETAVNKSYLKGVSDNTAVFEKTFPIRDRNGIGLGGSPNDGNNGKTKGKIASFGKTSRINLAAPTT